MMNVNLGQPHPSRDSVLRLVLELYGETVLLSALSIGYLHTGMEKTAERKKWQHVIPLVGRMDYLSAQSNSITFCRSLAADVAAPKRAPMLNIELIADLLASETIRSTPPPIVGDLYAGTASTDEETWQPVSPLERMNCFSDYGDRHEYTIMDFGAAVRADTPNCVSCAIVSEMTSFMTEFRTETASYLTGVRFYEDSSNTRTHIGNLWSHAVTNLEALTLSSAAVTTLADYVIGPEDVLSIVFWRDKDMSAEVTVRPDGKVPLPLLNDIQAVGLTPAQLRDRLTEDARRYIEDPNVTVVVRQINSRRVFVTGEVVNPGPYRLIEPTTMQILAMATFMDETWWPHPGHLLPESRRLARREQSPGSFTIHRKTHSRTLSRWELT